MKHSIKICLKDQNIECCSPIRMRVSWRGKRTDLYTGLTIEPDKWDAVKCEAKPKSITMYGVKAYEINTRIRQLVATMDAYFDRCTLESTDPSVDDVKSYFNSVVGRATKLSASRSDTDQLSYAFDKFMLQMGKRNEWSYTTVQKFRTLKMRMFEYNPGMTFNEFTDEGIQNWIEWYVRNGYRNSTIYKVVGFIKWFAKWAGANGYLPKDALKEFKPKLKGADGSLKPVIYLEWDELMRLYEMDITPVPYSKAEETRDIFCFQCFTGLRFSDATKLLKSDIHGDYFNVVTQKTNDALKIELNKYSKAILDKYKDKEIKGGRALPIISNQKANDNIKALCELAGIDTVIREVYFTGSSRHERTVPKYALVSTHAGRRTFVVNALRLGIPSEVIMKWTGHSDFKAMRPYVAIVDKIKEESMAKFDNFGNESEKKP